ncbi:hypothetical protein ACP4OV_021677 [Aristida adscensionis]
MTPALLCGAARQDHGDANQGFYLLGLDHTSPTFASAIQNSVPAITFAMAAALGIERVRLARRDGLAKVAGTRTLLCVAGAGASVITLFKDPAVFGARRPDGPLPVLVGLAGAAGAAAPALPGPPLRHLLHLLLRPPPVRRRRRRRRARRRRVASRLRPRAPRRPGRVGGGVRGAVVQTWCIGSGGPVFVAVYQPMQTLLVAVMASLLLGERFYLGGIIGAVLIIAGLYQVLWNQSQERALAAQEAAAAAICDKPAASCLKQPLLPTAASSEARRPPDSIV